MGLRIRRGSDEARANTSLEQGEIVWTTSQGTTGTNYHQLWVGTGIGTGGVNILETSAGFGLTWNSETQRLEVSGLTADDVANGVNNKYFTNELAVDAVAAALVAGNATNVGITFTYSNTQDDANRINATVALDGVGITDVVNDTTPQLGGNLDLNDNDITGTGNINITGTIDTTGDITAGGNITNGVITITNGVITSVSDLSVGTTNSATRLDIGTSLNPNTLWIKSSKLFTVSTGLTDGANTSGHSTRISRGILSAPTAVQPGDSLAYYEGLGFDGTDYIQAGAFGLAVDPDGTVSTGSVPGYFAVLLPNGGGTSLMSFNKSGVLTAPVIKATPYTSGSLPATAGAASEGFIVFDTTTKQFKGWNGSAWVVLG